MRRRPNWRALVAASCALLLVAGWSQARRGGGAPPTEWPVNGGTALEQHFSPLAQINETNVGRLGLAWSARFDTNRGQEATPIMVDGVLYVSTAWSKVYAYDAVTGRELWRYDPLVNRKFGFRACCDVVNRGVAVAGGRVFLGALDGRLIALDARTGKQLWSAQTTDTTKPYTITAAPRVFDGKVVIGNGGADYGVRGFVSAYDAATGKRIWRFYTVPGDPAGPPDHEVSDAILKQAALPTWAGKWYQYGGGGTAWDAIVYDPELHNLYIGVGNGSPWNRKIRSDGKGDNLFLASIVALDPDTGAYKWHYQVNPGESWDYSAAMPIMLATLKIGGRDRKVLMQAPKNGFFYVIDRTTGKLISAENFVPVNWARGIDLISGRPKEVRNIRYDEAPFSLWPGPVGAHSWQAMAFSPKTGLVYIPANHTSITYSNDPAYRFQGGRWNTGAALGWTPPANPTALNGLRPAGAPEQDAGELIAWDPVAQKARWSVRYPSIPNGGVLATAGNLVFQGGVEEINAFRASDGAKLWSAPAGTRVIAAPISYMIGGVQYVAVPAGTGGSGPLAFRTGQETRTVPSGRMLVFRLDGKAKLPADDSVPLNPPQPSAEPFTQAQMDKGRKAFGANCFLCHGGYVLPDLRRSGALQSAEAWRSIVIDGALEQMGMVSFREALTPDDAEAIRAYINGEAKLLAAKEGTP